MACIETRRLSARRNASGFTWRRASLPVVAGLVVAGLVGAGSVVAGVVVAGLVVAGSVVAGLVVAGSVVAGLVVAGLVVGSTSVVGGFVVGGFVVGVVVSVVGGGAPVVVFLSSFFLPQPVVLRPTAAHRPMLRSNASIFLI